MEDQPTVFIVDDDEAVRDSLCLLLKSIGLEARSYPSAQAFLDAYTPDQVGCLVLDIRMPGMNGLELQNKLIEQDALLSIIFITGHGDVPMAVEAMKHGAIDFIQKPFSDQELLDCIDRTLEQLSHNQQRLQKQQSIRQRLETLTERERQVMELMVNGKANKVIAIELEISQRTVEIHRAHVMKKMQASSLAQLINDVLQIQEINMPSAR